LVDIIIRVAINAAALIVAVKLVPGVAFTGGLVQLLAMAIVFGLVNGLIRPVVRLLSLPLRLATFGLIGFVINIALVLLAAGLGDSLDLGFTLGGWPPGPIELDTIIAALGTSLVISVVSTAVALVRKVTPG
jgi:putative membrane protein